MKGNNSTALRAIRAKCLDCCLGSTNEIKLCPSTECALYPFRLGKNPNRAGIGNAANFASKRLSGIKSD